MTISSKAHRGAGRNGFQPSSVFLLRLIPKLAPRQNGHELPSYERTSAAKAATAPDRSS